MSKHPLYNEILTLALQLFCKEDHPAIRKSLRDCLVDLTNVYVENGKLLAFAIVCPENTHTAIISFCGVSPTLQGKGIGSKLLKETITGIFQAGFTSCQLIVDDWNTGAKKLYEKLGFKVIRPFIEDHTIGKLMELDFSVYQKLIDYPLIQQPTHAVKWITASSL